MRPEHATTAGKPTLRCTLAAGLTQYVRRRNQTSPGPRRRSSCTRRAIVFHKYDIKKFCKDVVGFSNEEGGLVVRGQTPRYCIGDEMQIRRLCRRRDTIKLIKEPEGRAYAFAQLA